MTYVCTYVSVTLRNVAVTSRRNVGNQRSYVILLRGRRVEPGNIYTPQAVDRSEQDGCGGGWSGAFSHGGGEGRFRAFIHGGESVGPSPMVTDVGRYAQT